MMVVHRGQDGEKAGKARGVGFKSETSGKQTKLSF